MQRPVWHFQAEEIPKGQGEHGHWCPLPSVLALSTIPVGATGQKALPWPKGLMVGFLPWFPAAAGHSVDVASKSSDAEWLDQPSLSLTGPLYSQMSLRWTVQAGMDALSWAGCPKVALKVPLHIWHVPCGLPLVASHLLAAGSHHSPLLQSPVSLVFHQAQGKGNPGTHRNVFSAPQS